MITEIDKLKEIMTNCQLVTKNNKQVFIYVQSDKNLLKFTLHDTFVNVQLRINAFANSKYSTLFNIPLFKSEVDSLNALLYPIIGYNFIKYFLKRIELKG